jgi:hypothetical protein
MPTKTPVKKKPASKAASVTKKKTIAKKVTAKKPITRKVVATKKKHPLRRLLEYRIEGSVSKKGFLISLAVVVGIVLGITGYSLYQNNGANAGGTSTLGRGWTIVKGAGPDDGVNFEALVCKSVSGASVRFKAQLFFTGTTHTTKQYRVRLDATPGYHAQVVALGNYVSPITGNASTTPYTPFEKYRGDEAVFINLWASGLSGWYGDIQQVAVSQSIAACA